MFLTKVNGVNTNPFFETPEIQKPVISEQAKITMEPVRKVLEYEFRTRAGKTYDVKSE